MDSNVTSPASAASASASPLNPAAPERGRQAVALTFFLHGILTGGWVPHVPFAKAELGVGPGVFGLLLLCMAAGAVFAMPFAGVLINRVGSAAIIRATGLLFCIVFPLPILVDTAWALAISLALFGATLGALDVAMNAHGLAVEIRLKRAVMSSFHGWFSVGAAIGSGLGGVVVGEMGETAHLVISVALAASMMAFVWTRLLPASVDQGLSGSSFAMPTLATFGLGALCFLALLIEGAMLDWSALHLINNVGAPVALAGFGYAAFSTGMAVARFTGDALRMRFGSVPLVLWSAISLAVGLAIAISLPWPFLAITAFAIAGLGVGNIAPVLFAGGGRAEPDAPGRGIAAVTTMGYAGFLLGPPLIGFVAELTGLRIALLLTVLFSIVIAVFARAARAADG